MIDHSYFCPVCFSRVSILIDPSIFNQEYIQDCEICCRPITFFIQTNGLEIVSFSCQAVSQ